MLSEETFNYSVFGGESGKGKLLKCSVMTIDGVVGECGADLQAGLLFDSKKGFKCWDVHTVKRLCLFLTHREAWNETKYLHFYLF